MADKRHADISTSRPASGAGIVASRNTRDRMRAFAKAVGARRAARELGIARETFARIVAGMLVRPGSIALAEREIDAAERRAGAAS